MIAFSKEKLAAVELAELVSRIDTKVRENLVEDLIDAVLETENSKAMPAEYARAVLQLWRRGKLDTNNGLRALFKASLSVEPEKTADVCEKHGCQELTDYIRSA
ncbi:MAG: hypothetical protein ACETWM_16545 [Candidatus Lokiarchaeia archaeon]